MDTKQKIKEIIESILEYNIEDDTPLEGSAGADSLDVVEIVMEVEKFFDVIIPDSIFEEDLTVNRIIKYLENDK